MNEIDQFGLNEQDVQAPETPKNHEFIQGFVGTTNEEIATEGSGNIDNTYYLQTEPAVSHVSGYATTTFNNDYMEGPVRAKEINISPLPHGYLVRVGCQQFAFEDHTKMMKYINKYLNNPAEIEAKFYAGKLFKK